MKATEIKEHKEEGRRDVCKKKDKRGQVTGDGGNQTFKSNEQRKTRNVVATLILSQTRGGAGEFGKKKKKKKGDTRKGGQDRRAAGEKGESSEKGRSCSSVKRLKKKKKGSRKSPGPSEALGVKDVTWTTPKERKGLTGRRSCVVCGLIGK